MSDPVTNVEIEDVLSSIRRLVAEGDKPRTSFVNPKSPGDKPAAQAERFVLTPALRVAEKVEEEPSEAIVENNAEEGLSPESEDLAAQFVAPTPEPLVLEPAAMLEIPKIHDRMTASERASLEATIAELEAAVTFRPDDEWEPDGSEVTRSSGLAEVFAAMEIDIDDAEEVTPERVVNLRPEQNEPTFRHVPTPDSDVEDDEDTDYGDDLRATEDDGMPIPDDLDETLAAYMAGGTAMDRAEMRQLVVDVVRQELQGEFGERISRNIRKLVRREIQRATTSNIYD